MKKKVLLLVFVIAIFLSFNNNCYAKNKIVLNKAKTDDVAHTFKYPDLSIDSSVKPYSITLSIENGYFNTDNETLNNNVSEYFNFRGGTNLSNDYISTLETTEDYKVITFNLKSEIDLSNSTTRKAVIKSIKKFLSDILFHNETNKDAKFTLSFSETALKLTSTENNIKNIDVIVFKDPEHPKEHYYAKIYDPLILWSDAYNIASSLKFNGLQGYLVTITSEAEHNFIYQSLGSIRGWMGAASIEDSDSITYNIKNISWNPATDKIMFDAGYNTIDSNLDNDNLIKQYWNWVSGPEAGRKIFDGYNNFTEGEPNNFSYGSGSIGYEWCGEYGHGDNGMWNDYPDDSSDIEGYYIEFGGFDDEEATVLPVSLVSTFNWKDYDFRNIEDTIEDKIKNSKLDEETTIEEIQSIVDESIFETGIENTTGSVSNKLVNKNKLSFDIEISIGDGEDKATYTFHVTKNINIDNPETGDNIIIYITLLLISIFGIVMLKNVSYNERTKI